MRTTQRMSGGRLLLAIPTSSAYCWSVLLNEARRSVSLALAEQAAESDAIMKKAPTFEPDENDELRGEYHFDYRKARPNRFAAGRKTTDEQVVVVLDPDVARVFTTSEAVNAMLR